MNITINHNGFHGRTSRTIDVLGNRGERVELSRSQIKKLARAACGMDDCKCGESMMIACEIDEPWKPDGAVFITIPDSETPIDVVGNYPQR
jgi:hypothetical protein